MMKHTKGEWKVVEYTGYGWCSHAVYCEDKEVVEGVYGEGNAKLIAAAPDLLEALIKAKLVLARYNGEGAINSWFLADKAIKKATE
jgi:hypothetical protein